MTSAYRFDSFLRSRRASSLRSRTVGGHAPAAGPPGATATTARRGIRGREGEGASPREATLLRVTAEAKTRG